MADLENSVVGRALFQIQQDENADLRVDLEFPLEDAEGDWKGILLEMPEDWGDLTVLSYEIRTTHDGLNNTCKFAVLDNGMVYLEFIGGDEMFNGDTFWGFCAPEDVEKAFAIWNESQGD